MDSVPDQPQSSGNLNGHAAVPTADNKASSSAPTLTVPNASANGRSPTSPPATSPPYWVQSHTRTASIRSIESVQAGIILRDNTDEDQDGKNSACWARAVQIQDHVVVNEGKTGIGSFVVFNISVQTLNGGTMHIRKRYSEFDQLRDRLLQTFPNSGAAMPPLPPKSVISKFRPKFLEHRRIGLSYFLNCVLLNPEFSGSPVLKEFLFS